MACFLTVDSTKIKEKMMSNRPPKRTDRENLTVTSDRTQVGDMEFKTAAIVTYIPVLFINVVMSVVYLRTEPVNNYYLRFHAMQSLFFSGAYIAIGIACGLITTLLGSIPFLNLLVLPVAGIVFPLATGAYVLISIFLMMKAQSGEEYKLPMFGDYAEQALAKNQQS
jgi:uncharacterized membrane protein